MYDVAVTNARESGREAAIVDALAQRSQTLLALGRTSEAAADMDDARRHLASLPDESFRRLLELPVLAAESDLTRNQSPAAAASAASRAIETIEQRRDRTRLPQFYLRLAKANIAWGHHADAELRSPRESRRLTGRAQPSWMRSNRHERRILATV